MPKLIQKCDCNVYDCGDRKQNLHVHVGTECVHKNGIRHKLKN